MAVKMVYDAKGDSKIELEPEDMAMLDRLCRERVAKLKKKKQMDVVDTIVIHALESLSKKLAS